MEKRAIVRVQVSESVKRKLDTLCEKRGMTQIAVMSRLVAWLCEQNDLVQASILGQLSVKTQAELAQELLQGITNKPQR